MLGGGAIWAGAKGVDGLGWGLNSPSCQSVPSALVPVCVEVSNISGFSCSNTGLGLIFVLAGVEGVDGTEDWHFPVKTGIFLQWDVGQRAGLSRQGCGLPSPQRGDKDGGMVGGRNQ